MKNLAFCILLAAPALAQELTVTNTIPFNGTNAAEVSADLVAQFSTNVMGSTVTSNRFFSYSPLRGYQYGAISFNAATNEAALNPDADFAPGERIFAYVSSGITNAAGSTSITPHAWSFFAEAASGNLRFMENGQVVTGFVATVACGDMNGDGHLDAVLALTEGAQTRVRVMLNDGHGVFTWGPPGVLINGGFACLVPGDMDGDGDLDVFVGLACQGVTWLLVNDGTGAFTDSGQSFPAGTAVAVGDFDGDGSLDAAIGDECLNDITIHLNNGAGVFNRVHSNNVGNVLGMDVGDVDGDGDLDIYTAGYCQMLLNDGTGHFTAGGAAVDSSFDAALGDLDGDGDLDAAVVTASGLSAARCLLVLLNDGAGHFTSNSVAGLAAAGGWEVELGDFDADGDLDAVVGGIYSGTCHAWIFTNDGLAHLTQLDQTLPSGEYCYTASFGLGDLDEDGALDIIAASTQSLKRLFWINNAPEMEVLGTNGATIGDPTLLVFEPPDADKGTRMGVFPTGVADFTNRLTITNSGPGILRLKQPSLDRPDSEWFRVGNLPSTLAAGAVTNLDIIFAPGLTGWDTLTARVTFTHAAWYQDSRGCETNMEIWISATGMSPPLSGKVYPDSPAFDIAHGATVAALFAEDPLVSSVDSNALFVYGSQGSVWHGSVSYDAGGRIVSLYPSSDFRPGEYITAVVPLTVSNAAGTTRFRPFAWSFHAESREGTGYFAQAPDPSLSNNTMVIGTALGDLNGDGMLDALVGVLEVSGRRFAIAINDGTGRLVERGAIRAPADSIIRPPTTLSDLDGDGHTDIVAMIGSSGTNGLAVWKNDGTGNFSNTFLQMCGDTVAGHLKTADVNGDGHSDVILTAYAVQTNLPAIWLNDGTGRFSPVTHNSAGPMIFPSTYWPCEIGDVNGDGAVDLVFGSSPDSPACHVSVWFNDGRGRFMDSGQQLESTTSWTVHIGDLNGNGHLDIFAVRTLANYIAHACILTNNGSGFFSLAGEVSLPSGSGQYHGQGLADLDGDGDLDAIVGGWELTANKILLNDGTGQFTISDAGIGNGGWRYSAMGDFTGDGAVDLLMSRVNVSPDLQMWLNKTRPKAGFGKALHFDGADDYLLMPGVPANQFSGSNDFTIAMWVRPETNGTLYRLYSDAASDQFRSALSVQTDGRVAFALAKGTVSGGTIATSATPIGWNRWSHVAAVKESNAIRVCVNGVLAGTDTVYSTVMTAPAAGGDTYLGATALPVGSFFRGDLDEIQIWNTALSDAQISDWMYRAPDRSHSGITSLVAHLDCNEGEGLRTTSREGPPIQGDFSAAMDTNAWMDSDVRDWRTWVNHPLSGQIIGSWADGTALSNLAFEIVGQGAFGTVELSAANGFLFTPPANQLGTNVFTYRVVSTNGYTTDVATAYVIVPPDYDEDHMADLWEIPFGLDPANSADAAAHFDDDLADNLSEYIADTDPTNAESFFHISSISNVPSLRVCFESSSNRQYSLNAVTDLSAGVWTNIPGQGPRTGSGGSDWMDVTNSAPPAFYRLDVRLP